MVYPVWVVGMGMALVVYAVIEAVLWVAYWPLWALFWPLRAWMKRNRPDEYAASQAK